MKRQNCPVYSLVAWSKSGKTTYLEKLLPCLRELGIRTAVVKHDGHDFTMDYPQTDTDRLTRAGAEISAILSSTHGAVLYNCPMSPEDFVGCITGVDLILTEGFKKESWPKILLYREARGGEPAVDPDTCFAVITDHPFQTEVPQFSLNDPSVFAAFLRDTVRQREESSFPEEIAF
mgnify:FL=1